MYAVSQAYKTAMRKAVQTTDISVTINNVSYDSEHVLEGSFNITNQCTDTSDITLGAVYTAELTATLRDININRNTWVGQTIRPTFRLKLANSSWESVPLGVFVVSEATWMRSGVQITAFDYMTKFDKNFSMNQSYGQMYDYIMVACDACHVELGNTQEEIEAMPNGDISFNFFAENDIETYRDLISWCAQTLGGFATIGRDGKLYIRQYNHTAVDTLGTANRGADGTYSDYITKYTGVSYVDVNGKTTKYHGAEVDDGLTMNLGSNPFLQVEQQGTAACENLLEAIAEIRYTPFKVSVIGNPAYDLGDVLTLSGGLAGTQSLVCMQKFVFNHHRKYEMSGYGANPALANARSKVDKNIAGLISAVSSDIMYSYEYRNVSQINIGDGERKQLLRVKIASTANTRVQIHVSVNLSATVTDGEIEEFTKATVSYYVDSTEDSLHPAETYIDGNHVLHLMYIMSIQANIITYFRVYMDCDGGSVFIDRRGIWFYASGYGILGDFTWDGDLDFEEVAIRWNITEPTFKADDETISVDTQVPTGDTLSDTASEYSISESLFDTASDNIRILVRFKSRERKLEDGRLRRLEEETQGVNRYRRTEEESG